MRRSLSRRALECWTVGMVVLSNIPTVQLCAQQPPLNAGALFLVFPVGAQAVGMGQTATAAAGRGEAAFWNPAGLATLSEDEFALHSATLVAGKSNVLAAYFPSRGIGVLGGAVFLLRYGDLDRPHPKRHPDARIPPRQFELLPPDPDHLTGAVVLGVSRNLIPVPV